MNAIKNKDSTVKNGTDKLCEALVAARFDELSEENIDLFHDRLLDMTGCIFGGAIVDENRFLYEEIRGWGGTAEAPLFAAAGRAPIANAALYNCLHARANDYGSMYFHVLGKRIASHFGETLIPLGLTLADMHGVSGRDFVVNNIAAEDMIGRVLYTMPVLKPSVLVSSGAAAVAARYFAFDPFQTKTALSYAATNATDPGNSYFDYCQEFMLHNGESARAGVMAAIMAKGGWRGLDDPFFGHWGVVSSRANDICAVSESLRVALSDVRKNFYTEESFKRAPGGIPTTAASLCGLALHARIAEACGGFHASEIARVRVSRSPGVKENYYTQPFSLGEHINALFCYRFAACCALVNGSVGVESVQTAAIRKNAELMRLAEEAEMEVCKSENGVELLKVSVELRNGQCFEESRDYNASMFERPPREFITEKFRDQFNAFGQLPRSVGEKIIELSGRIEELQDMREYTELLTV